LLVAINAKKGILTNAGKSINFVDAFRIVEAWLRQAVVHIHVAGGSLETWQTKAGRRHVPVHALGPILTQRLPFHDAIVGARAAQSPFPAALTIAGKVVESIYAPGLVLTRDKLALVEVNFTYFAGESWNTRARKSICFVYTSGAIDARTALTVVSVYSAQGP
jgi:hypothetical protein